MTFKENRAGRFRALPSLAFILAVGIGLSVGPAQAQTGQSAAPQTGGANPSTGAPATTMSVKVNVVNVYATVRDKHGKIVNTLTKDDFTLSEDGRPQSVHYFRQDTDLPLTLGLLVDTSLSQRRVLDQEQNASHSFLDQMVREDKDKAFVIHFDREVELLQDLTSSHQQLEAALQELQTPQLTRASTSDSPDSDPQAGRGSRRGGGTLLYDAVFLASNELMAKQEGRKAVIVLSDGVDRGSKESLDSAITSAQRADTVVYSILFKDDDENRGGGFGGGGRPRISMGGPGMGGPGMGGGRRGGGGYPRQEEHVDGKKILERISKETGGRLFEVSKKEPIDGIYAQIEDELRHQYSLGYTPDRAGASEPGYHKIELTTKEKSMAVQTRAGYYSER